MSLDLICRKVEPSDLPAVVRLAGQLGYPTTEAETFERLEAIRQDDTHAVFVAALSTGEVVGWIHVYEFKNLVTSLCSEIGGLVVDQNHRNHQIGEMLLFAAENWSRGRGLKIVRLSSNAKREDAHRFYLRLGYEKVKTSYRFSKVL